MNLTHEMIFSTLSRLSGLNRTSNAKRKKKKQLYVVLNCFFYLFSLSISDCRFLVDSRQKQLMRFNIQILPSKFWLRLAKGIQTHATTIIKGTKCQSQMKKKTIKTLVHFTERTCLIDTESCTNIEQETIVMLENAFYAYAFWGICFSARTHTKCTRIEIQKQYVLCSFIHRSTEKNVFTAELTKTLKRKLRKWKN